MNIAEKKAGKNLLNGGTPVLALPPGRATYSRSISPPKAGLIYGKFKPSPVKVVMVRKSDGKTYPFPMARKERRGLERDMTRIQRRKLRRRDK